MRAVPEVSIPSPLSAGGEVELDLLDEPHAGELFALVDGNRAYLRQWLPWLDQNTEVGHTRAFIQAARKQHADGNGFTCGIRWRGQLVGVVGLHAIDWANRKTSVGYWVAEAHQGKGIVTRACAALLPHLFDDLFLNRVEIGCAPGNAKSAAVPERLGFVREGLLRQRERLYDRFVDQVVYGLLASEWRGGASDRV
jgi:ribosomal-protein-serine acetyltransferase